MGTAHVVRARRWSVAIALLLCPRVAAAQVIRGAVSAEGTGAPLRGAVVTLLDGNGNAPGLRVLTDNDGSFAMRAPSAGSWVLEARAIGYAPRRTNATDRRRGRDGRGTDRPATGGHATGDAARRRAIGVPEGERARCRHHRSLGRRLGRPGRDAACQAAATRPGRSVRVHARSGRVDRARYAGGAGRRLGARREPVPDGHARGAHERRGSGARRSSATSSSTDSTPPR